MGFITAMIEVEKVFNRSRMARHELFEEKTTTSLVPKRGSFAMNPPLPPQMYIAACVHEALAKYKWGVPALGKTKISNIQKGGGAGNL